MQWFDSGKGIGSHLIWSSLERSVEDSPLKQSMCHLEANVSIYENLFLKNGLTI
jgi:hypothetical protein